jgi:hypothetical protein
MLDQGFSFNFLVQQFVNFFQKSSKINATYFRNKNSNISKKNWFEKTQKFVGKNLIVTSYENHFSHFHGLQLTNGKDAQENKGRSIGYLVGR